MKNILITGGRGGILESVINKINIDIIIYGAAVMESGSLIDIPIKKIRYNFEVNF